MLLAGAAGAFHKRLAAPVARSFADRDQPRLRRGPALAAVHPISGSLASGAANGLLPCGLVYAAVAAATGLGDAGDAALLMTGFGLGTTPALVAMSVAPAWVPITVRSPSEPLATVAAGSDGRVADRAGGSGQPPPPTCIRTTSRTSRSAGRR